MVDVQDARTTPITLKAPAELHSPSFTPDGQDIAFVVIDNGKAELRSSQATLVRGQDVFPFRPTWTPNGEIIFAASGKIQRLGKSGASAIRFSATVSVSQPHYTKRKRDFDSSRSRPVIGIGSPSLSPDGQQIVFRALNDLWILPVGGKATALIKDSYWKCDPAWSPDGTTLAYSTDRGGNLQIWLRDIATGSERQLTHHAGAALSAAWSRDAKRLAFLDQTGALYTVEIATGTVRQVFGAI